MELGFVKERMNPGPLRSGQRVPNSPPDRFVCELRRVKHSLHSDQELTDSFSVSQPVTVYTSLSGPVAVRWHRRESMYGGRGRFPQRAWQMFLSSRMPGHRSILCSGKFTLRAAASLDWPGFYQMAGSTLVVWKRSTEGERQAERGTIQRGD